MAEPNLTSSQRRANRNGSPPSNGKIDRLPPHSQEFEQALLGCILTDAQAVLPLCIGKITPECFYDLRHQTIYQTALELYDDQSPVEPLSVYERLQTWGKADQVGGITYITQLPDNIPSSANAEYYLGIIREKAQARSMIRVCTDAVGRLHEGEGEIAEVLDGIERDVLRTAEARVTNDTPSTLELVRQAIHNFETYNSRQGELVGLDTGFSDFNRMTTGLRNGDMIVIAGRPSMGKTSLAMNIAEHVAVDLHLPTAVFSLEMTGEQLMERMLATRSRVNLRNIREGFLADRDLPRITLASSQISQAPLYIDDKASQSILEVRAKARRLHSQHNLRLVVIDYLQLMTSIGSKRRYESRQQEVSDISSGVKALAKELNLPVIVLSQLNRDVERDKNRAPRLSDLRESGTIEQDADLVAMLYRRRGDDDDDDDGEAAFVQLIIAKQRNGPTGKIDLTFLRNYTRFESAARISDDDVPNDQTSLPYRDA